MLNCCLYALYSTVLYCTAAVRVGAAVTASIPAQLRAAGEKRDTHHRRRPV